MAAEIRVLFRYRDLVDKTLERHREVITASGSCWWGWWKRPSEGSRMDVWEFLADRIRANQAETVGLFDSGGGRVYTAKVVVVVKPVDESASTAPPLPDADRQLVPTYYRDSVFSRAWMKLTDLSVDPILNFFDEYAYETPPPLPKIPPKFLAKLTDKRIVDDDELRAMDTTIWRIKKAATAADKTHFLAPSWRVIEAVSRDPIPVKGTKILHLSDIHYDERPADKTQHSWARPGRQPLHDVVTKALGREAENIGLLVVSGDLTFSASAREFEVAFVGLNALMGVLDLGPEHVILCPGNHDISWTKPEGDVYDPRKDIEPSIAPVEAMKQYVSFYSRLLQHAPNSDLSMGRRFVFPHGRVLELCSLNSTSLAAGNKYLAGMGRIGPTAFESVRSEMRWSKTEPSLALRTLVLHHHVVQTEDVEQPEEYYTGFGLAIDAQKTLREAAKSGFRLVLHGHRHRAFYWRSSVYELPESPVANSRCGDVAIIGGGSAGSTQVVDYSNYFNLIDVGPTELLSTMYRSQRGGAFDALPPWKAQITQNDRGVVLSEWSVQR